MDADNNGYISEAECRTIAKALVCNPDTFWQLLKKYDDNSDGHISREEFAAAMCGRVLAAFFPGASERSVAAEVQEAIEKIRSGVPLVTPRC